MYLPAELFRLLRPAFLRDLLADVDPGRFLLDAAISAPLLYCVVEASLNQVLEASIEMLPLVINDVRYASDLVGLGEDGGDEAIHFNFRAAGQEFLVMVIAPLYKPLVQLV